MTKRVEAMLEDDGDLRQAGETAPPVRRTSRLVALDAKLIRHPLWLWGVKPVSLGILAVLATSPLLIVLPLVADAFDMHFPKSGVIVMAFLVWAPATSIYFAARLSGALDERDRLSRKKKLPGRKTSFVNRLLGVEDEATVRQKANDVVRALLREAGRLMDDERLDDALRRHRDALREAMGAFQRTDDHRLLYFALHAYHGISVCAFQTERTKEAAVAVETGMVLAGIGMERWPAVPQFVERQALLASLKWKTGLEGVACLPEDWSQWPFED